MLKDLDRDEKKEVPATRIKECVCVCRWGEGWGGIGLMDCLTVE